MAYFNAIEEVLDYQKNMLENAPSLSVLEHIGFADDELFFAYPAVAITAEPVATQIHATRQFKNFFNTTFYVYHGEISENRTTRTREDLLLVSAIKAVLHSDYTMGGGVIFGWIDSIIPGTIRRPGNLFVIGSRMSWRGEALESF